MFEIIIFENKNGESSVKSLIEDLKKKEATNKGARISLKKIREYIRVLKRFGTRAGEKYTKHIEGNIWELRPQSNRIFFFFWIENTIVLLHSFQKKSQKTPKKEIEQARRNMDLFLLDKEN